MDESRFDDLARILGARSTRRGVLAALTGAALASFGLGQRGVAADKAGLCRSVGNACKNHKDCCSGECVNEGHGRKICHCASPADCPSSANACVSPLCQTDGSCGVGVNLGGACNDGDACTTGDVCQPDGSCQGTPLICPPAPNECFTAGSCQGVSGACSDPSYRGDGTACSTGICFNQACCAPEDQAVTCAGGACGIKTNNCGQSVQCLRLAAESCSQDGDCCSGVCVDGVCQAGRVATGGACDSNSDCASSHCCAGVCRDLTSDLDNCGACGNVCPSGSNAAATCVDGACGMSCADGFTACGNACVDLGNDASNCGGCGVVCSIPNATAICEYGGCVVESCDPGLTSCGGLCNVNTATDANNCGACGNVCEAGAVCHNGSCCTPNCTTCINVIGQPPECQYAPGSCNFDDSCGGVCNDCPECTACQMIPGAGYGFCTTAAAAGDQCETNDQCIGDACCMMNHCVICDYGVQNGQCAGPPAVGGTCAGGFLCDSGLEATCCYDQYCRIISGRPKCCDALIGPC